MHVITLPMTKRQSSGAQAAQKKSLQITSAYISTLGGGYFMCRFVGKAKSMARQQLKLAEALGDEILQSKCRTHLIYNDIQLGDFNVARHKLSCEMIVAEQINDAELTSIIQSALHYCEQCREINKTLQPVEVGHGGKLAVEDEYYRMRVVKCVDENKLKNQKGKTGNT